MAKSSILIKLEREHIIDSFLKIKETCGDFYKKWYAPKYSDVDSMEIRGRLDFINEAQTKEISELMNRYKDRVFSRDIEAIFFDYKDSLCATGKLDSALIEVDMYGQMTFVNQGLFNEIKNKLMQLYTFPSLKMAYISYSALTRGSESSLNFHPFFVIEESKGHTNIIINHDAKSSVIKLRKPEVIQPKSNPNEYFSFGKHPSI